MIRIRLSRLLAAVAVLALTTFASASAVASTSAPNQLPTIGLPPGKFLLIGDIARPQILDVAALQAMPSHTITVTFKAGGSSERPTLTSVRAWSTC